MSVSKNIASVLVPGTSLEGAEFPDLPQNSLSGNGVCWRDYEVVENRE